MDGSGVAETDLTLPVGHYIVSYAANVWNTDNSNYMITECLVLRTGVVLDESVTRASELAAQHGVLANSFGLDIAGSWLVQLRCYKQSGDGSFSADNVQLTAIKVASLN